MLIRPATAADLPALGRLGAMLMRVHYDFDVKRFLEPGTEPERGYASFLGTQTAGCGLQSCSSPTRMDRSSATCTPRSSRCRGRNCATGRLHPRSRRRSRCARGGAGAQLLEAAVEWLRGRGMPRVVLWTAEQNAVGTATVRARRIPPHDDGDDEGTLTPIRSAFGVRRDARRLPPASRGWLLGGRLRRRRSAWCRARTASAAGRRPSNAGRATVAWIGRIDDGERRPSTRAARKWGGR